MDAHRNFRDHLLDPDYVATLPDTGTFDYEDLAHLYVFVGFEKYELEEEDVKLLYQICEQGPTGILRGQALQLLIEQDEAVKVSWLEKVMENDSANGLLLSALIRLDRLWMLPKKYQNQEFMAEKLLRRIVFADEMLYEQQISKMKLLRKEKIDWQGEPQVVYTYQFALENDLTWYFGVSGPFPKSKKAFPTSYDLTGMAQEPYSPGRYDNLFEQYMRQMRYTDDY